MGKTRRPVSSCDILCDKLPNSVTICVLIHEIQSYLLKIIVRRGTRISVIRHCFDIDASPEYS